MPARLQGAVMRKLSFWLILLGIYLMVASPLMPQFRDDFDGPDLKLDPEGVKGWTFFSGAGQSKMEFKQGGPGYASIFVDATADRRNVWWALIKRQVSDSLDLSLLKKPEYELRVEARVRVSHAPRRINLHLNTQKTTDFHTHLMEFDIPDTENWHTVSMTTRDFEAEPGDRVNAQMALMDWGLGKYRVDVDYIKVDVVDVKRAGPDNGEAVVYHPPVADREKFGHVVSAKESATVDVENPEINLGRWYIHDSGGKCEVITAGGSRLAILRWDLSALAGREAVGSGLLELTTRAVERTADDIPDFGLIRVVEIHGGDVRWEKKTVNLAGLLQGKPFDQVFNTQTIIDWPVAEGDGAKTYLTISRPVLRRLLNGKTLGLAILPLGAINASFYGAEASEADYRSKLRLNTR